MVSDSIWDIDKYKDEHETDEQWDLRKTFIERWKDSYSEDRLICLSKVFINVECLGSKYPKEVMEEISTLTKEIVKSYREQKKNKLRRVFVSASTAAKDKVTATKRSNVEEPRASKTSKIEFVPASTEWGQENKPTPPSETITKPTETNMPRNTTEMYIPKLSKEETHSKGESDKNNPRKKEEQKQDGEEEGNTAKADRINFASELEQMECLGIDQFDERMFNTEYGKLVLLIRPWADFVWNIQATCQACRLPMTFNYENEGYEIKINNKMVARYDHKCKNTGRSHLARKAWDILRKKVICLLIKEKWVGEDNWRVNTSDVCPRTPTEEALDVPVQNDVAVKMMQMMGWKGGGLGSNSQGIAEPIKPNVQVVNRAGLGSDINDERNLKRVAFKFMRNYRLSGTIGVDLVFSSDFTKSERAVLHYCAKKSGLSSRSYGDRDRFLVVRRKQDGFAIVKQVIAEGGSNKKYQVFIPAGIWGHANNHLPDGSLNVPSTSRPDATSTVTSNYLDDSSSSDDNMY